MSPASPAESLSLPSSRSHRVARASRRLYIGSISRRGGRCHPGMHQYCRSRKRQRLPFLMFSSADFVARRSPFHQYPRHFPTSPAGSTALSTSHTGRSMLRFWEKSAISHLLTFSRRRFSSAKDFTSSTCLCTDSSLVAQWKLRACADSGHQAFSPGKAWIRG